MDVGALTALLEPVLSSRGLELDKLDVVRAGNRSVLRITVDGDGPKGRGPLLDEVADASKAISAALDESNVTGSSPYLLEVSTRGVSTPLTKPAHWRRNKGRLVKVTTTTGSVTGRIAGADDTTARLTIDGDETAVPLDDVSKAVVQVELNRPHDPDLDDTDADEQD